MLGIKFARSGTSGLHLLCLGAHSDDIEIGCGGTILRLLGENPDCSVTWIVFSASGERRQEAEVSGKRFLESAREKEIIVREYRDGFFPYTGVEIKSYFEELKGRISPDVILTHAGGDYHQDHRLINELTWNTFRDHLILEYEIPKYDGDLGSPNFFVPLPSELVEKKVNLIIESFLSQEGKRWFSKDTFLSLMRIRGVESNSPFQFAEGFYARKLIY